MNASMTNLDCNRGPLPRKGAFMPHLILDGMLMAMGYCCHLLPHKRQAKPTTSVFSFSLFPANTNCPKHFVPFLINLYKTLCFHTNLLRNQRL